MGYTERCDLPPYMYIDCLHVPLLRGLHLPFQLYPKLVRLPAAGGCGQSLDWMQHGLDRNCFSLFRGTGKKISIALAEMDLPHTLKPINIGSNVDQFTEEFKAVSPNSKIPAIGAYVRTSEATWTHLIFETSSFVWCSCQCKLC